jgi:hypothetical protein
MAILAQISPALKHLGRNQDNALGRARVLCNRVKSVSVLDDGPIPCNYAAGGGVVGKRAKT